MSLGALESDLCPELLDEVIEQAGVREQRRRLLPARTVMVFVLGLCVFCGADSHSPPGYRMVMCWLTSTFGYLRGLVVPSASALCQARKRLGVTPLRLLFDRVRGPRAAPDAAGAWLFGRRLVAFDGTALDLADTAANVAAFGHIGTPSGFAQVRLVALIECATHAIIDAVFDACRHSEQELTQRLIGAMRPGMLVLADRNFGHRLFAQIATSTGADLIWRIKGNADFPAMKILDDGSYLSVITAQRYKKRWRTAARRGWPEPPMPGHPVRIVDYRVTTHVGDTVTISDIRLVTTLLDPAEAPARAVAEAYHQRWESENSYQELKTRLRGAGFILRSKSPDLVDQEIYALLVTYQALCTLRTDAADTVGVDPRRISFTITIRVTRDTITAGRLDQNTRVLAIAAISSDLNPPRRARVTQRVKKPPRNTFKAKRRDQTRPPSHATHKIKVRRASKTALT
ncbi:IS4 family transposase [Jiangella alkaliphila]|uniref:IS4 family transposase n=1 Tax=Jiangella alkaliphila TaxID=419479 RepID=UPI00155FFCF6|nr:IS4 family transposase [Jiangella alkaliphila]